MMLRRIWPWSAIAQARDIAKSDRRALRELEALALEQRGTIDVVTRDRDFAIVERDAARAQIEAARLRKSRQVAEGNRTRARKRRDLMLPPPINDDIAGHTANLRTEQAG